MEKDDEHSSSTDLKSGKRKTLMSIIDLTQNLLDIFMRDLFIGISLTLLKSKNQIENIENKYMNKFCLEIQEYIFDSNKRAEDVDYFKDLKFERELEIHPAYVRVIEHAPKIFKRLRKIENLDEKLVVTSLMNIKNILNLSGNKGGKSNALFLPTKDYNFLIKTMEDADFYSVIQQSFLTYYLLHLENNSESLICRFYGIFTVFADKNASPVRLILMRNAKGGFSKYIRGTYDLKGSTMNRKINIPSNKLNTKEEFFIVKKDLNFKEDIGSLDLKDGDKKRFLMNTKEDSLFFEDLEIMDYSLFIYRLEFTEEELNQIKSNENFKYYQKYFYESKTTVEFRLGTDNHSTPIISKNEEGQLKGIKETQESFEDDGSIEDNNSFPKIDDNLIEKDLKEHNDNNHKSSLLNSEGKKSINNSDEYKVGYLIMIIDYLQKYNFNKQMETGMKSMFYRGIASSAPPNEYSVRFINYCKSISTTKTTNL